MIVNGLEMVCEKMQMVNSLAQIVMNDMQITHQQRWLRQEPGVTDMPCFVVAFLLPLPCLRDFLGIKPTEKQK